MKSFKIIRLCITVTSLVIFLAGCKKEMPAPLLPYQPKITQNNEVVFSPWFTVANWEKETETDGTQSLVFYRHSIDINADILSKGKLLVFVQNGDDLNNSRVLPAYLDKHSISAEVEINRLNIRLYDPKSPFEIPDGSMKLTFRYVTIPEDKLVAAKILNYNDYVSLCTYYDVSE